MYETQEYNIPNLEGRVETGPVKFNHDWTGLFVRGDDAFSHALHLSSILEFLKRADFCDPFAVMSLRDLISLLQSTREHP